MKALLVQEVTGLKKENGEIKTELQNNTKKVNEVEQKGKETHQVVQTIIKRYKEE